jgi:hypothetical protein
LLGVDCRRAISVTNSQVNGSAQGSALIPEVAGLTIGLPCTLTETTEDDACALCIPPPNPTKSGSTDTKRCSKSSASA